MSLKVNKAIATGSVFITNHLQTQRKEEEKDTDTGVLHTCTRVSCSKTHPHFSGAFTLPDILLPLQLSRVGVLAAGQGQARPLVLYMMPRSLWLTETQVPLMH